MKRWFFQQIAKFVRAVMDELHPPAAVTSDDAIKFAFRECGVGIQHFYPEANLLAMGKVHEVLIHAARRMGNPLATVADVQRLLK
jgi:hypothetical protein